MHFKCLLNSAALARTLVQPTAANQGYTQGAFATQAGRIQAGRITRMRPYSCICVTLTVLLCRSHLHLDEHGGCRPLLDRGRVLPLLGAGRLDAAGRKGHHCRADRRRAGRLLRRALGPHVCGQRAQARGLSWLAAFRRARNQQAGGDCSGACHGAVGFVPVWPAGW